MVTINSSSFDTSDFDRVFNSSRPVVIPPEDITWLFEPFSEDCVTLVEGGAGVVENPITFSADRLTITNGNIQVETGGGTIYRIIRVNGTTFIQTVTILVNCKQIWCFGLYFLPHYSMHAYITLITTLSQLNFTFFPPPPPPPPDPPRSPPGAGSRPRPPPPVPRFPSAGIFPINLVTNTFQCVAVGVPLPTISWFVRSPSGDTPLTPSSEAVDEVASSRFSNVTVSVPIAGISSPFASNVLFCQASNSLGDRLVSFPPRESTMMESCVSMFIAFLCSQKMEVRVAVGVAVGVVMGVVLGVAGEA